MRLRRLRVRHPDVFAGHHGNAASHHADRRDPDEGAVRRGAVQAHHLQRLPLQLQAVAVQGFRNDDVLGRVLAQLRAPDLQLDVLVLPDGGDGLRRGHDPRLGELALERIQPEVVVRVRVADINGNELLAAGLDLLGQLAGILGRELCVDQDGFLPALHQGGGHGKDGFLTRVVGLDRQRRLGHFLHAGGRGRVGAAGQVAAARHGECQRQGAGNQGLGGVHGADSKDVCRMGNADLARMSRRGTACRAHGASPGNRVVVPGRSVRDGKCSGGGRMPLNVCSTRRLNGKCGSHAHRSRFCPIITPLWTYPRERRSGADDGTSPPPCIAEKKSS